MKEQLRRGFVVPGEQPVRTTALKKLALLFDEVVVAEPGSDRLRAPYTEDARTVELDAGGRKVQVPTRIFSGLEGPLPLAESHEQQLRSLQSHARRLGKDVGLRFVETTTFGGPNPESTWMRVLAACDNEAVWRAAAVDYKPGRPPPMSTGPIIFGTGVDLGGNRILAGRTRRVPLRWVEDKGWQMLLMGRIARTVRFIQIADVCNSPPIALDPLSAGISRAVYSIGQAPDDRGAAASAELAVRLFDEEVDQALLGVSWDEIKKLRAETLPKVAKIHQILDQAAYEAPVGESRSAVRKKMAELRNQHDDLQEQVHVASDKLRLGLGLQALTQIPTAVGIVASFNAVPVPELLAKVLASALALVGASAAASSIVNKVAAENQFRRRSKLILDVKIGDKQV